MLTAAPPCRPKSHISMINGAHVCLEQQDGECCHAKSSLKTLFIYFIYTKLCLHIWVEMYLFLNDETLCLIFIDNGGHD